MREIPAGLAAAIHARFGLGPLRLAESPRSLQLADSPTEHPYLGGSVSLSADGTTALVSVEGAGNKKGALCIYHVASPGSWTSTSTPTATLYGKANHGLGERLGWSATLSADGTTAFATAPASYGDSGFGSLLVFHVADESSWVSTSAPTATLTNKDKTGEFFGMGGLAVSSDGTTVVLGDWSMNLDSGGAYVSHAASESAWTSMDTPTATLSRANDTKYAQAGTDVAISGDGTTVLVGEPYRSNGSGGAYLFHVASEDAWTTSSTPTAILTDANGVERTLLGAAVALSSDGTTAFLGAPGVNDWKGAVDVYRVLDESSWATTSTPTATLADGAATKNDYLGGSVAVSTDGATAFVSAPGALKRKGATYVFHVPLEAAWVSTTTPTATLTSSAAVSGDFRGDSLGTSADGATLLIGAPLFNWSTGSVDVFHATDSASWSTTSTPTATLTNAALPKPRCIVPAIKGEALAWAKEDLDYANCRLGKVKRVHAPKKQRRKVVAQSPAPKTNLPPGSKVNVKIGK